MSVVPRWSPDSQYIVSRWNKDAQVYRVTDDGVTKEFDMGHSDDIWDISFSPDGQKVLVGYGRYKSDLWDFNQRQKLLSHQSCTRSVRNEAVIHNTYSLDGRFYALRWDKEVLIYNAENNQIYTKFKLPWYPLYMQFSPDSSKIAVGTKSDAFIADLNTMMMTHRLECTGFCNWTTSVIYPEWIGNDTIVGRKGETVRVWKIDDSTTPEP